MPHVPQGLIDASRDGRLVPFVGAGLSLTIARGLFPDWKGALLELAELAAKERPEAGAAVRAHVEGARYDEAAQTAADALGPRAFGEALERLFGKPCPSDADLACVEAVWRLAQGLVVTTNFDGCLGWPFVGHGGRAYDPPHAGDGLELRDNEDHAFLASLIEGVPPIPRPRVWHLHGMVQRPQHLVFTRSQYAALYGDGAAGVTAYEHALQKLRDLLETRTLFFVGFSLQDPFVAAQLGRVFELTAGWARRHYLFVLRGEVDDARRAALAAQNVELVEFEGFGARMTRHLRAIVRAAGRAPEVPIAGALEPARSLAAELAGTLEPLELPPALVAGVYEEAKPWPVAFPTRGDGALLLRHAVASFAQASIPSTGEHALVDFGEGIAERALALDQCLDAAQLEALRARLADWLARARAALPARAPAAARAPRDGAREPGLLLVRLDPRRSSPGEFGLRAWFLAGEGCEAVLDPERAYAAGELEQLAADVKLEAERRRDLGFDVELAFELPHDLLALELDQLRPPAEFLPESPLGASFPLTLRCARPPKHALSARRAAQAWKRFKENGDGALALAELDEAGDLTGACWIGERHGDARALARLLEGRVLHCALLLTPPTSTSLRAGKDLLLAILQAGVPVALWARSDAGLAADEARAVLTSVVQRGAALELPRVLLELRRAVDGEEAPRADFRRCLSLLWEDADRVPPLAALSLES